MTQSNPDFSKLSPFVLGVGIAAAGLATLIIKWAEELPRAHQRKARLQACRARKRWRKADIPKLRGLGVGEQHLRRVASIRSGRKAAGRGTINYYQPLDEAIPAVLNLMVEFCAPETRPRRRMDILKKTPLWPAVVESLYRGEYATHKTQGVRAPADAAEEAIANALFISTAVVRVLCTQIRKDRGEKQPDCPPLRLADLYRWQADGKSIWSEKPDAEDQSIGRLGGR